MATQTLSIKTSGGDATTLSGAEALISNGTDDWVLRYDEAMTDTTACVINYAVTSGSITATVATGFRHNGTLTHSGAKLSGSGNPQLQIDSDNVTVEWLHVRTSLGDYCVSCVNNTTDGLVVRNCVIERARVGGSGNALIIYTIPTNAVVQNCLVYHKGTLSAPVVLSRGYLLNCTVYATGTPPLGVEAVYAAQTYAMNSVVIGSFGTAAYENKVGALGTGNNAGSDTSAPGSTAYDSFDGSQFVDLANGDPHWDDAATAATYPGADASAYMVGSTADNDGTPRVASVWDIGCDQIRVPAAAGRRHGLSLRLGLGL